MTARMILRFEFFNAKAAYERDTCTPFGPGARRGETACCTLAPALPARASAGECR
jgi:hypothetical protein